jgi:hypothetical protein
VFDGRKWRFFQSEQFRMSMSLYDVCVPTYLQILSAVDGFLEKGKTHCAENGIDLGDVTQTRLFDDMWPFQMQVISVAHHSMGALKGLAAGEFSPPSGYGEPDYEGLQALIVEARAYVESVSADEVNNYGNLIFRLGKNELPFTAENFVMTFSFPNFYFHAATAYDMLRMKGVPVGKADFIGKMRMGV